MVDLDAGDAISGYRHGHFFNLPDPEGFSPDKGSSPRLEPIL